VGVCLVEILTDEDVVERRTGRVRHGRRTVLAANDRGRRPGYRRDRHNLVVTRAKFKDAKEREG
jgi:hypothetical protein